MRVALSLGLAGTAAAALLSPSSASATVPSATSAASAMRSGRHAASFVMMLAADDAFGGDVGGLSGKPTHLVLYLSKQTWLGEAGERLADEIRRARAAQVPIVMVHENDMAGDGCEFGLFFSTTPQDLIKDGLYKALALALCPPPFHHVSSCLVARALGADHLKSGGREGTVIARTLSRAKSSSLLVRAKSAGTTSPIFVTQPAAQPAADGQIEQEPI